MKVFRGIPNAEARAPCALTIGNFDGVHLGHKTLISHTREAAARLGIASAVMTFEPHPREFFARAAGDLSVAPTRISNLRDKLQSLAATGVERAIVMHFNAHFAALSPRDFVEQVLVKGLNVKWLMVGEDFCFGARRAGNFAMLQQAGAEFGFEVHALPAVEHEGVRISSSAVRAALTAGDFSRAAALLGHPYAISGHVIHGKKLGRTIGFPTMNLRVAHKRPATSGIFVVRVHGLGPQPLPGVASLGVRPTVDDSGRVLLETWLFDYDQQCYGRLVCVELLEKLRDEKKYDGLDALVAAINNDAEQARAWFRQHASGAVSATDRI
ncbi:bifunctional riboflavin kinase/FAD synthetase [Lacisediminimonas sp.]|uniref:bifunctional riboflavin kinase/FAD synthetase n=1 Tax=Lacisediminimonas sp. TaxID=3060582 RepID=UPI0027208E55|nr:bifunctional riboflavin kinase/FAD synthetase [Lacisediminimonas sp.]MDO8298879.1 bifunctional riboflavin kinase/FAD synthetase [Lacisediminimonas sp.]MDO9216915.1 bifunctional riboflavin kinase/FAD synthetase [Lacisediminimonas sp.]